MLRSIVLHGREGGYAFCDDRSRTGSARGRQDTTFTLQVPAELIRGKLQHRPRGMRAGASRLQDLIGCLYETVARPESWARVAELFPRVFRGTSVLVTGHAPLEGGAPLSAGIAQEFVRSYAREYGAKDPWLKPGANLPEGSLCDGRALVSASDLVETEFYQGWMLPQGLKPRPVLVGVLSTAAGLPVSSIRVFQPAGASALQVRGGASVREFALHLSRVLVIEQKVVRLGAERDWMRAALDVLPQPVILVDDDTRVVGYNASAAGFLSPGGVVGCAGCRLYTCEPAATAALRQAIGVVCAANGPAGPGRMSRTVAVACPNRPAAGLGRGLTLTVSPLQRDGPGLRGRAVAAVTVGGSHAELPDAEALGCLFCLTPAEARLAHCLGGGRSLKEAAGELDVSIHTLRAQLRAVFAKTGTTRQAELVRLLLTGSVGTFFGA